MSVRQRILEAVIARLAAITPNNGYQTNAGERLYIGETPELGQDDPVNAIAVVVQDETHGQRGGYVEALLPVECQAVVKADLSQPYISAEEILADIMRAMEQPDRTLGSLLKGEMTLGATRVVPREPGMSTVAVGITYELPYTRTWGTP